ncbi:MAG TPA: NAD(P)H-hydrate epimerase, partial [Trueperaceae bacterium]|nr:NAD(P)H-hydrate epimerase [Trueperaceae bacterium]
MDIPTIPWNEIAKLNTMQMQQLATLATGKYGLNNRILAEHSGRNLALLANALVPSGPVLVVAGRGYNGSGGLAAARLLAAQQRRVWVVPTHEAENYSGVTKEQLELLRFYPNVKILSSLPKLKFALVIDAAIGTQLEGPPRGRTFDVITVLNAQDSTVISLDIPTGMMADDGEIPGIAVNATATLAIALPKKGTEPGENVGDL